MDRLLLILRWVGLAIALGLNLWAPTPAGFAHEPETAIFAVALYSAAVSLTLFRWRRPGPRRLLILDTVVFTAGLMAAGGWHSSLFVLFFLTTLSAALQLAVVESLAYVASVSLLYVGVCVVLPNWDWGPTSIEVLIGRVMSLLFAGLFSIALVQQVDKERRLRKGEEEINSRLTVLNELMSLELGSKLELSKTLDGIARLARRAIDGEFSAVCLFPGEDQDRLSFAFDGVPEPQQADLFREAHLDPIGEVVVRTGQPLLIADISRDGPEAPVAPSFHRCRTLVCVPIKLEDAVIGVLYNGVRSPDEIDQKDVDLLVAMGRHTALAIANARMYDRERSNVERLSKLEQMKSEFLSTVSHQLRTPITSISTAADLLMSSSANLEEDQKKLVSNVGRNVLRLDNLVTDLLQMARLKEGQVHLARQAVSPASMVNDAVAAVKLLFDAREQRVQVRVAAEVPRVDVDRKKVEHVLVNLLGNACKFTQRGGEIVVELAEGDGGVEFTVRDNGPGMAEEVCSRAFEPFYSSPGTEGPAGTGLGLAIAKGLVELHGGGISLESDPGCGTTVRFTLPIHSEQPLEVSHQQLAISGQQSVISSQRSAISSQQSAVSSGQRGVSGRAGVEC